MSLIDHKELSLLAAAVQGGQHSVKFVKITIFRHFTICIVIKLDLKCVTTPHLHFMFWTETPLKINVRFLKNFQFMV